MTISLQRSDLRTYPDSFYFESLRYSFLKLLHEEMYFSIVNTLTETGNLGEIYVHMLVIQLLCSVLKYSSAVNGQVICVNFLKHQICYLPLYLQGCVVEDSRMISECCWCEKKPPGYGHFLDLKNGFCFHFPNSVIYHISALR